MEANILRILVLLTGIALVAVIMIQQPKEGGMGAFTGGGGGSGASSTVFGAKGSGSFLFRLTAGLVLAFVIFIVTLVKVTNSDTSSPVLVTTEASEDAMIPGAPARTGGDSIPGADKPSNTTKNKPADTSEKEAIPGASNE